VEQSNGKQRTQVHQENELVIIGVGVLCCPTVTQAPVETSPREESITATALVHTIIVSTVAGRRGFSYAAICNEISVEICNSLSLSFSKKHVKTH